HHHHNNNNNNNNLCRHLFQRPMREGDGGEQHAPKVDIRVTEGDDSGGESDLSIIRAGGNGGHSVGRKVVRTTMEPGDLKREGGGHDNEEKEEEEEEEESLRPPSCRTSAARSPLTTPPLPLPLPPGLAAWEEDTHRNAVQGSSGGGSGSGGDGPGGENGIANNNYNYNYNSRRAAVTATHAALRSIIKSPSL
ncbi:unnamed protein product, partial [Discosporangium mesarthrocarpum]